LAEFTGERLVPELVNADLLNEHLARYVFARQFAHGKHVLDAGCGVGYGSAALASVALSVKGLDYSSEAITEGRSRFAAPEFIEGSCEAMPFDAGQFDLVIAFEVIEHLSGWEAFLQECVRVLTPGGLLIVSTPNREYYSESRRDAGPNPFHVHEFDAAEFRAELQARFGEVKLLLQNHAHGVAIAPAEHADTGVLSLSGTSHADDANFFVALCSQQPVSAPAPFFYLPTAGNVLKEREHHIALLEQDLAARNAEHRNLVEQFRALQYELEERNEWAANQHRESVERGERIVALQAELQQTQQAATQTVARLEFERQQSNAWAEKVQTQLENLGCEHVNLQAEHERLAQWHHASEARRDVLEHQLDEQLQAAVTDLARCNQLLTTAEQTVVERTRWAQDLQAKAAASNWIRIGRKLGLVPQL
jgi:SAM-dependent methyltransferase